MSENDWLMQGDATMIYTFLDVETPNRRNDRICSIGLIQVSDEGEVVDEQYHLVNPQAQFDDINMSIHRITPIDVKTAPTFPELWEDSLASALKGTKLVAHNAPFDLCVLTKSLRSYSLMEPKFTYACTRAMARLALPACPDYKLSTLCDYYGIELLHHHSADDDARACCHLFWNLAEGVDDLSPFFSIYHFAGNQYVRANDERRFSRATSELREFVSMADAALADGDISLDEALAALEFLADHSGLMEDRTIHPIALALQRAAMDGEISRQESAELAKMLGRITDPGDNVEVVFAGKTFHLSGSYEHGTKEDVYAYIESLGGIRSKSFTKKCDYIVIGGCGNEAYAMGNYGTKVKKALDYQQKGCPIKIIHESDLYPEGC